MSAGAVQGLADSFSLMDALPKAAELEAARDLYDIGKLVLTAQRGATPEATGALKAGLNIQVLIGQLRERIGLLSLKRNGKINRDLFYGLFVRYGRKEQVVLVQRRRIGTAGLRPGRKRAEDIAATYSLPVKAMAGRDYIDVLDSDPALDSAVTARLATFWSRVLPTAGATE